MGDTIFVINPNSSAVVTDAIDRAVPLDLDHCPLTGLVRPIEPLGDNAVQRPVAGLVEPSRRRCGLKGPRRKDQPVGDAGMVDKNFERVAASAQRGRQQIGPVGSGQHVEQNETRRRFGDKFAHPAFGWVQTHLQGIERGLSAQLDHQLSIDDEPAGAEVRQQSNDFREVSPEGLP